MSFRDWSFRRWALVIALIILLPLAGLRLHLKWRVHRAVAELRAAGNPTTWEELSEYYGRVPDDQNAAPLLTNAFSLLIEKEASEISSVPIVGRGRLPPIDSAWPQEVMEVTHTYLNEQAATLQAIHTALQRPEYRLYRDHSLVESFLQYSDALKLIRLSTRFAAQAQQWPQAWASMLDGFRLPLTLQNEPNLMASVICRSRLHGAVVDLEQLLKVSSPNADTLVAIRLELQNAARPVSLSRAIVGERVGFLEPVFWKSEKLPLDNYIDEKPPRIHVRAWRIAAPVVYRMSGLADRDLLYFLEKSRSLEETAAGGIDEWLALAKGWDPSLPGSQGKPFYYWSNTWLAAYGTWLEKWAELHGRLHAADAALAVAQYRLQHDGKLPASLDELVPEFLEAVPAEPQSGQPFELIVTADGYGIGRGTAVFNVKLPQL
jgi:hypothetical protein